MSELDPEIDPEPTQTAPLTGLIAATLTPFTPDGEVNYELIPGLVDHLYANGVSGIYICGSTGESPSLTMEERMAVTEAYLTATQGRLRTVVQIGHTSLKDMQHLAEHAVTAGAEAISAVAPYYFKPGIDELLAFYQEATKAADTVPFYYYHIPAITGTAVDPVEFLRRGADLLPTLRGIKYTDPDLSVLMACQTVAEGRFDALFGRDEMFLPAYAAGIKGFVGSTYNLAPALYRRISAAFDAGNHAEAVKLQHQAVTMIRTLIKLGGESAIKYPLHRFDLDCGQRRLPMKQLSLEVCQQIDAALDEMGFDDWAVG